MRSTYNERSWAIDLIAHLKHLSSQNSRSIKDVGGEQTIRVDGGSLFPDVLLFGDKATARILQGWELKMPDTSIDDQDFFDNAKTKADALGLDSFVLWNVSHVKLFLRDPKANSFILGKSWSDLSDVNRRELVLTNKSRWKNLATDIFFYLNDLFDNGTLEGRQFIEAYRSGGITSLIMENSQLLSESLELAAKRDVKLRSEIIVWWNRYRAEYAKGDMFDVLAKAIISNWIGKLLFANILREKDDRAHHITTINEGTTPEQALKIFKQLSEECNFWTIFSNSLGLTYLPPHLWNQLKQFNYLLTDLRLGSIDQSQLSVILESTVEVAIRKVRGQYPTPIELARLLIHLCLKDIVSDKILDPCCGSGTIIRAALEEKLRANVPAYEASACVFAGDQDPQAVQIATFALTSPSLMHMPLRIFQEDAFTLEPNTLIEIRNPSNGNLFTEKLGNFDAITSNLPFISQKGRKQFGNALNTVADRVKSDGTRFSRRADVAAYLPFSLHPLLINEGRLGIIITNAWLGTDWGDAFYEALGKYYNLTSVITSGAGRWFQNCDVVANLLILEKKIVENDAAAKIKYIVLTRPLEEMADEVELAAAQIEVGQTQTDTMTIREISREQLKKFRRLGLGGNAQFVNCDWVLDLPLISLNTFFKVKRGARRGKNKLFYPAPGHQIESDYIKPLAKSPGDFKNFFYTATKEAFSCSHTEEELELLGHSGALKWINMYKSSENIKKLSKKGHYWYEMKASELTDLVMSINYYNRLFVGRLNPPAFADQRFARLIPRQEVDLELFHALLNTTISMFVIEGLGFGRGLGALDLSKGRIEKYMQILNPSILSESEITNIKLAFEPLKNRNIMEVADELEQPDRHNFDDAVIKAFNLNIGKQLIYDSLLALVEIRATATT